MRIVRYDKGKPRYIVDKFPVISIQSSSIQHPTRKLFLYLGYIVFLVLVLISIYLYNTDTKTYETVPMGFNWRYDYNRKEISHYFVKTKSGNVLMFERDQVSSIIIIPKPGYNHRIPDSKSAAIIESMY